jgi:hypothetical protein
VDEDVGEPAAAVVETVVEVVGVAAVADIVVVVGKGCNLGTSWVSRSWSFPRRLDADTLSVDVGIDLGRSSLDPVDMSDMLR